MTAEQPKDGRLIALVVDDSPIIRRVLNRLLSEQNYQCHEAKDGPTAIEAFNRRWQEQQPYDLICLDIHMPDVDGIEVLTHVRNVEAEAGHPHTTKVLILTADDSEIMVKKVAAAGADSYLLKPIDRELLDECLNRRLSDRGRANAG